MSAYFGAFEWTCCNIGISRYKTYHQGSSIMHGIHAVLLYFLVSPHRFYVVLFCVLILCVMESSSPVIILFFLVLIAIDLFVFSVYDHPIISCYLSIDLIRHDFHLFYQPWNINSYYE